MDAGDVAARGLRRFAAGLLGALLAALTLGEAGCGVSRGDGAVDAGLRGDGGAMSLTLTDFRDVGILLHTIDDLAHPLLDQKEHLWLSIDFVYSMSGGCRTLPAGTVATLNRRRITLERGGEERAGFSERIECVAPSAFTTIDRSTLDGQDGRLEITDGDTTFTVVVTELFSPRAWIPDADLAHIHVGQDANFKWSIATDAPYSMTETGAYFDNGGNPPPRPHANVVDGVLHAVFDNTSPSGPGLLNVWGSAVEQIVRCEGPATCRASVSSSRNYPIVVE